MFAAQLLGDPGIVDQSACPTPISVHVARLREELRRVELGHVEVVEVDLYALEGAELDAALDGVAAGADSPFVLVDSRLVCTGEVAFDSILEALRG